MVERTEVWRIGGVSPVVLPLVNGGERSLPHLCQSLMNFLFIQQDLSIESFIWLPEVAGKKIISHVLF